MDEIVAEQDLYGILGVSRTATMMKSRRTDGWHGNTTQIKIQAGAESKFKAVSAAFAVW